MATKKKVKEQEKAVTVEETFPAFPNAGNVKPEIILYMPTIEERVEEEIRRTYGNIPEGNVTALLRAALSELVRWRIEHGRNEG
jgi:hypothetical protein